jgi:hypothetical protein
MHSGTVKYLPFSRHLRAIEHQKYNHGTRDTLNCRNPKEEEEAGIEEGIED